ncbi:hypothetical protein RND81_05G235500 [Saponaria officinalis]|uniref:Uncharacterized protein n=1 Tax=Saponaria officinalis TaxID=3572 RepID=A0AAW1L1N7_SAPOF
MVSRVEEAKRSRQIQEGGIVNKQQQKQSMQIMQCNKGNVIKFKRSSSNLEQDGASSAILFLACIACAPSF